MGLGLVSGCVGGLGWFNGWMDGWMGAKGGGIVNKTMRQVARKETEANGRTDLGGGGGGGG